MHLVSVAGEDSTPILDGPDEEDSVVYSPDGSSIAYVARAGAEEFDTFRRDLETDATSRPARPRV